MTTSRSTYKFQTEARQVLEMMVYSVYSNKDIFLRELISNASDALDKFRIESLTNEDLKNEVKDLHIRLEADPSGNSLSISDNGIGMSRDEIREFIGTIARSGTKEYLEYLKNHNNSGNLAEELIGQFGVGFYSSFMVAEKVTLLTRRAGETQAWKWESTGDGTYSMEETQREDHGTTVILSLKAPDEEKGMKDYTREWTIREIVRKYSDFVSYPVKMEVERKKDDKTEIEDVVLNSMKAIWARPESEVTPEEFSEFYKHISHDWNEPWKRISMSAEGISQFRGLFFIPSKASSGMFFREQNEGISLYIKRVFIMNDWKDLIPEYLRFVRGVIDSEDLPLNISREILQDDPQVKLIRRSSVRKILSELKKIMKEDAGDYRKFWNEFGVILKEGIVNDPDNRKNILELSLFPSTASKDDLTTLEGYLDRMQEGQEEIYYVTGQVLENLRNSPHLEAFVEKGYEILLLADPVDEIVMHYSSDYEGKKFVSVGQGNVRPGTEEEKDSSRKVLEEKEKSSEDLLSFIREKLGDKVKNVRLTDRLSSSPACLVTGEEDVSPQMEQILRAMGQDLPEIKRILEINPDHPLFRTLNGLYEKEDHHQKLGEFCELLYDQAVLAEGGTIGDPAEFGKRIADLMIQSVEEE